MEKNDILNKCFKDYNCENIITEDGKLHSAIIDAMSKFAQQQVNDANTKSEECTLHNVRNLLINFKKWSTRFYTIFTPEKQVDLYIKEIKINL